MKWLPRGGALSLIPLFFWVFIFYIFIFLPVGLYITGGLTPKNLSLIVGENGHFMKAFRDKVGVFLLVCFFFIFLSL